MHELSITESILSIALEKADAVKARKVTQINLVIGELAGIVDECVQFYFNVLSRDTIAAEATLSFERTPLQLRCRNCDTVFSPDQLDWACPQCREQKVEVISGRECHIHSIEVD